jgi:hypothetical protein
MKIPQLRYAKAIALAAAAAGLFGSGALIEHWRGGKKFAEYKLTRASALNDRQRRAMEDGLSAVLSLHGELAAARVKNRELARASALAAPTAPEYACRDKPLPETFLETFRQ